MKDPNLNDHEIWQNLINGDQQAFEHIYRHHIDRLLKYGLRFCSDANLVEDSLHDLFADLWKNRRTLGLTDSIIRYLMKSLRRRIIRNLSKEKLLTQNPVPESIRFEAELAIDQQIIVKEKDRDLKKKMAIAFIKLSDRQREALYLKFYQNMDYEDICEIMEINYQSARNLVFRAIQTLRDLIISIVICGILSLF